jgi:hypothetical protein
VRGRHRRAGRTRPRSLRESSSPTVTLGQVQPSVRVLADAAESVARSAALRRRWGRINGAPGLTPGRSPYFGCDTTRRYGFSVLKPCGYFFLASSSETDVGMMTS